MSARAILLDRDGVINNYVYNPDFGTVDSPSRPDQFTLLPGVGEAIARINHWGFLAVVISNQPGIAKGKFNAALLDEVTNKMRGDIRAGGGRLDGIYYCLHHPQAIVPEFRVRCECRKPKPGLIQLAARDLDIDLSRSFMVGDGITDIEAGRSAGTRTVFIGQRKPYILDEFKRHDIRPDFVAPSLDQATSIFENACAQCELNGK